MREPPAHSRLHSTTNRLRDLEQKLVKEYAERIEKKARDTFEPADIHKVKDLIAYANTQLRFAVRRALKA